MTWPRRSTQKTLSAHRRSILGALCGLGIDRRAGIVVFAIALAVARPVAAQDTFLLVIAGVDGDPEHGEQFHKWAMAMVDAARTKGGLPDANITYLGDKVERNPARIGGRSTKEAVAKAFADLAARARPSDEVFIVLFGHGSYDGRQAAFNLPGPDLTERKERRPGHRTSHRQM